MKTTQKGFTLIELIVVIIILGILAATALPKFMDYRRDAEIAALKSMAGALSSATQLNHGKWMATKNSITGIPNMIHEGDNEVFSKILKDNGLVPVQGCAITDLNQGQTIDGLMSNSGEIAFDGSNYGSEVKYLVGSYGTLSTCLGQPEGTVISCPVYLKDKRNQVLSSGCTEENYCVEAKLTCLSYSYGSPTDQLGSYISYIGSLNEQIKRYQSTADGYGDTEEEAEAKQRANYSVQEKITQIKTVCAEWKKHEPDSSGYNSLQVGFYNTTETICNNY